MYTRKHCIFAKVDEKERAPNGKIPVDFCMVDHDNRNALSVRAINFTTFVQAFDFAHAMEAQERECATCAEAKAKATK